MQSKRLVFALMNFSQFRIPDSIFLLFDSVMFQTRVFFAYFENSQKNRVFNEIINCLRNLAQYDIKIHAGPRQFLGSLAL